MFANLKLNSGGLLKKAIILVILAAIFSISASVVKTVNEPDRLTYHVTFPASIIENQNFTEIDVDLDEWTISDIPGAPEMPYKTIRIAVPPAGRIQFNTRIIKSKTITLNYPLLPVPTIIPAGKTSDFLFSINESLYTDYSSELAAAGEASYLRGFTIIPLTISPCDYDHRTQSLTIYEEFEIEIEIIGNTNWRESSPYEKAWLDKDFIANYQQARYWRQAQPASEKGIIWNNSQLWYRLDISGSNSYCLSAEDLSILPDFADYSTLRLFGLTPDQQDGETSYFKQEIPLSIQDDHICFDYLGSGTVLWLAIAGDFPEEPARTAIDKSKYKEIDNISEKPLPERLNRPVECLIIRPQDYFESQTDSLIEMHLQYFNVQTAVAIQEDIFGRQSSGIADPISIKNFLQDYYQVNPSLDYVVLLGSGTYSFENSTEKNKIITYDRSSVTSDDFFVDFNDDKFPELAIGRIPAQNEHMLDKYLERVHNYYDELEKGWWQNKILLIADDEYKKGGFEGTSPGSGMNHTKKLEETAEVMYGRLIEKVYGLEYPFDAYQSKPEATADIIDLINDGVLISYYIGHGAWDNLGDEDYFGVGDIQLLQNYSHLTHFVAASCNVGEFDQIGNDCIAEVILFADDGGAISSVAASEGSGPLSNSQLMRGYFDALYNDGLTTGKALQYAKNNSLASITNSNKYNYFGDPLIYLPFPIRIGSVSGLPDSLSHRQTVSFQGDFGSSRLDSTGETIVTDSPQSIHYYNSLPSDTTIVYEVDYLRKANRVFRGEVDIQAGLYSTTFIIPDDAVAGQNGEIITLTHDEDGDWLNNLNNIKYSESTLNVANDDAPMITVFLDSENFRSGDTVSEAPQLIADITDENGINVSGSAGKSILVLLDDSNDPDDLIDVTEGFLYNSESYTQGILTWQFDPLPAGNHNLKLIVYDNFGSPAVASIDFRIASSSKISISKLLPYPNPMSNSGYFTFVLTEPADVSISIYTISGKKIKVIKANANTGYNQIAWDCRDADGDRLANNTYFYKVKATSTLAGNSSETTGKLIILH